MKRKKWFSLLLAAVMVCGMVTFTPLTAYADEEPEAHSFTYIPGTPATCQGEGLMPHWYCENCHRYFDSDSDPYAEGYESETPFMMPGVHDLYYVEELPATCQQPGVSGHWVCHTCGQCFDNADGTGEAHDETYYEIPKHPHTMVYYEGMPPTCMQSGTMSCWYCSECVRYYDNEFGDGMSYDDPSYFMIPPSDHSLTYVAAVPPTAQSEGNIEYWVCEYCGAIFSDSEGTQAIAAADTVLERLHPQGDIDSDGAVTIQDATGILRFLAEMIDADDPDYPNYQQFADFNGDNKINVHDVTAIQRRVAGIE